MATDLHTFNTSLGSTIEAHVTAALNESRMIWDPDKRYAQYRFVRQSQTFPDVILKAATPDAPEPVIMGIELKGWFALSKEGEPSFRYRATPAVCMLQDLLVVFPWALSDVVAGRPLLFPPYIESARYVAEYRNWNWQHEKTGASALQLSTAANPYPLKSEPIADEAINDKGGNFGRIARTNLMDSFKNQVLAEELSGIPVQAWIKFLKIFSENTTLERALAQIDNMTKNYSSTGLPLSLIAVANIRDALVEIANLLQALSGD